MTGAYLDHAGVGRVRRSAVAAMHTVLDEVLPYGTVEFGRLFTAWNDARDTAARLLQCSGDEIAMVPNTSAGLHLVADGLDWRAGDEVVVFDADFPANVRPWLRLTGRGVLVHRIPLRDNGYDLDDLAAALNPLTRLVAVSHVNFRTGHRVDLDRVCALAAEYGALVSVDAVQSLGTRPVSVAGIDFLAAGGHKWLCAPPGTGVFFCRRERLDELRWAPSGWFGFDGAQDMLTKGEGHFSYDLPPRPNARRFEGGMPNLLGLVGFAAALRDLEEIGLDVVRDRITELTTRLRHGLVERGYRMLNSDDPRSHSGIVACVPRRRTAEEIVEILTKQKIHVSHPDGKLRVSPHYWTTDDEIDAFLTALPADR